MKQLIYCPNQLNKSTHINIYTNEIVAIKNKNSLYILLLKAENKLFLEINLNVYISFFFFFFPLFYYKLSLLLFLKINL